VSKQVAVGGSRCGAGSPRPRLTGRGARGHDHRCVGVADLERRDHVLGQQCGVAHPDRQHRREASHRGDSFHGRRVGRRALRAQQDLPGERDDTAALRRGREGAGVRADPGRRGDLRSAPEVVFTVRTYATNAPYEPTASAQICTRTTAKRRSTSYRIRRPPTVIKVRSDMKGGKLGGETVLDVRPPGKEVAIAYSGCWAEAYWRAVSAPQAKPRCTRCCGPTPTAPARCCWRPAESALGCGDGGAAQSKPSPDASAPRP
jgi:hypothetical protein